MNKPRNITRDDLLDVPAGSNYPVIFSSSATVKLNGVRFLLLLTLHGCWLIFAPFTIYKFGRLTHKSYDGTLLDGEFKDQVFHVFDILFYKNKNVQNVPFLSSMQVKQGRLAMTQECVQYVNPYYAKIVAKRFYTEGFIYDRLREAYAEYDSLRQEDSEETDGIIIQPSGHYKNNNTLKWKPYDQLTIDFKFIPATLTNVHDDNYPRIDKNNYKRAFILGVADYPARTKKSYGLSQPQPTVVDRGMKIIPFNLGKKQNYDGDVILTAKQFNHQYSNAIVECAWNRETAQFEPIRIRYDKNNTPNAYETVKNNWRDIQKPICAETLKGENLEIMRIIHNDVKRTMLSTYTKPGDTIIDIGSGRGGDLNKWYQCKLKKIYAIEPFNWAEFQERFDNDKKTMKNLPEIKLLKIKGQNTKKIIKAVGDDKIDAIVSFFSLTFFGENNTTWEGLFKTLALIPVGGHFIGIVMDGDRTAEMLEKERAIQELNNSQLKREIEKISALKIKIEASSDGKSKNSTEMDSLKTLVTKYNNYELFNTIQSTQQLLSTTTAVLKSLDEHTKKRFTKYTPIDKEQAVDFDNSAFFIGQKAEFLLSDPTENKIGIIIKEKSSMVKGIETEGGNPALSVLHDKEPCKPVKLEDLSVQIEWLFMYEIFKTRMATVGFEEIHNNFLVDGRLPENAYLFSSINRAFVFQRK